MRRGLLLLLVLAALLAGCTHATRTSSSAMRRGDELLQQGRYAEAVDAFVVAASETPSGPVHEEALRKAAVAVSSEVATQPLPAQVAAMKRLLDRTREPFLPLFAHNWLCDRLDADARFAVADAQTAIAANTSAIASATAGVSEGTTQAAEATNTAVPRPALATYAEYRLVAGTVAAVGQPPATQNLYAAVAELRAATEASAKARGTGEMLTREQLERLGAVNTRLLRGIDRVNALLPGKA